MLKFIKNWLRRKYGNCIFGHLKPGVYLAGMSNCLYKCDDCGETWKAYQ